MSEQRIVLVGNAHIDMIYRWRLNETLGRVVPDTFGGVLDVMERHRDFTYAQSQFALYEAVKERYPEIWKRILERIGDGRWIVVGGKWVECDSMLPGGEALIRQFLIGNEFAAEEMGLPTVRVAWIPDCFGGHCHTTPQIYAGCGIDYYVFNRGCPEDVRCFYWESPDGSRLFAYKIPQHYNLVINRELDDIVTSWNRITGLDEAMVLYGEGDHGGGPRDGDMQAFEETAASSDFRSRLEHGTPISVLERARAARDDWPVLNGDIGVESGTGAHRGAHVSQARIKRENRLLEHEILVAERLATLGALCQRKFFFPRYDMRAIWKRFLLHQFHDTLPGTLVGDAVDDVIADYSELHAEAARLTRFGLEALGARIDTRGEGIPVMVFNPSPWERDGQVSVEIQRPTAERIARVTDNRGESIPFVTEKCGDSDSPHRIRVLVRDLPPLGFRLCRAHTGEHSTPAGDLDASPGVRVDESARRAENGRVVVEWSDRGVERIYDKLLERELISATANTLRLEAESESSSWHVRRTGKVETLRVVSGAAIIRNDGLELRVRWEECSDDSRFTRDMVLPAGGNRVDFELHVDWHEADKLLSVVIPTSVGEARSVYEAPYGWIERPADGTLWPTQKWVTREDGSLCVAVLNNGIYSNGGSGETVELAVLRGARDMDPRMDEGRHTVRYAIRGFASGDDRRAIARESFELAEPLIASQQTRHIGTLPDWGSFRNDYQFDGMHSFLHLDAEHTELSVVKILEGDWNPGALIVRLHEVNGRSETVRVQLFTAIGTVTALNHIERPIAEDTTLDVGRNSFSFDIGPHQIRTFRVDLEGGVQGG